MIVDDAERLRHIRDAVEKVYDFVRDRRKSDLDGDAMLLFALVRAIEVIGEAAVHLSLPFREQHPEIPWTKVIGMRNRLIHGYFDVDANVVWDTATVDIPELKKLLDGIPY
jgi:uncharacterized protein with HEPN domain